ncbi:MAG TPA: hypothetical protein VGE91_01915 [Solirubrobacterales bacterium]|jgi:hypothetical protein
MAKDGEARDDGLLPSDSDGYQPNSAADIDTGSDSRRPDSPADIGADSDGYPSTTPPDGELEQFDEGMRPLIESWKSMREGWWNKAGYETYWDVVKEDEAAWKRMGFRSIFDKPKKRPSTAGDLPDPSPPEIDLDAVARDGTRPRRPRDQQVNVRLTELGYQALREAARSYGLRPSTLARLLIHRGAIAVLADRPDRDR